MPQDRATAAELLAGKKPSVDLSLTSPDRFA